MAWREERRQKRHILLMALVLISVLNHGIRLANRFQPAVPSLGGAISNAGATTLNSLDRVRQNAGRSIRRVPQVCPGPTRSFCSTVVSVMVEVMGLGE